MSGFNRLLDLFRDSSPRLWSGFDDGPMLSSCWSGSNAVERMMNVLSPHMPDHVFRNRLDFQRGRGCNVAHVILCNERDGEYGGYCPYGAKLDGTVDAGYVSVMRGRLTALREAGLAVVPWVLTDDGPTFNRQSDDAYRQLFADCAELGLFEDAPMVVLGLELNEYFSSSRVAGLVGPLRAACSCPIGIHQTSDRTDYAGHGDVFFWQTNPGKSPSQIKALVNKARASVGGKPIVAFEMERTENRALSQAALDAGAVGVGNW